LRVHQIISKIENNDLSLTFDSIRQKLVILWQTVLFDRTILIIYSTINTTKNISNSITINFSFFILENNFQESRCVQQIDNLRECCKKFHEISLVCSGMKPSPPVSEVNQSIKVSTTEILKNNIYF